VVFVAACDCGGSSEWHGSTEHPPTDAGERAAEAEWERIHTRPLLQKQPPAGLDEDVSVFLARLRTLAEERPEAVLPALRRIERATDDLLHVAVAGGRAAGKSWSELGTALGMTEQSTQLRFALR
jgi:hypothetical protein